MNSPANQSLLLEFSTDGENFTAVSFPAVATPDWKLVTIENINLPATSSLTLRFSKDDGSTYRVDDVLLTGVSALPTFVTTPLTLDMNYIDGEGPSTAQMFSLSAINWNVANVNIGLPADSNFEISTNETSNYGQSIVLNAFNGEATNIYVQLKADLAIGNYADIISISGGGAATANVGLTAKVFEKIFLIYEFTGETLMPTQFPLNGVATEFQVSIDGPVTFGTAQPTSWTAGSGIPYANSQTGWGQTDVADAKFFFFTLTADNDYVIAATNFSFEWRCTANGPSAITVEINDEVISTFDAIGDQTNVFTVPITYENQAVLDVKIKGWDNASRVTNGTGFFRINDVRVNGEITPVLSNPDFYSERLSIYPNPTNQNFVNISVNLAGDKEVSLFDLNGRILKQQTISSNYFDLSEINSGLYLIQVKVGNKTFTQKLAVK
jgi:hypothetical protein